jgi:hypothetical protein
MTPPAPDPAPPFSGYPLAARPRYASLFFYVLWPLGLVLFWWLPALRARRSARVFAADLRG